MGSKKRRQQRQQQADHAYRQALGLAPGAQLPDQLGTMASAGAARGGRGAAQRRTARKHPIDSQGARTVKPGARKPLTGAQARIVPCPRCLAPVDQPCRDQHGKAYSAGHAARQHRAAAAAKRRPDLVPQTRRQAPPQLTEAQQAQREVYRQQQAERERLTGVPTSKEKPATGLAGRAPRTRAAKPPAQPTAPVPGLTGRRASAAAEQAAATVTDAQALARPCVRCRAVIGQPCRDPRGKELEQAHHGRRRDQAITAARRR